jgi:hypothetical protein
VSVQKVANISFEMELSRTRLDNRSSTYLQGLIDVLVVVGVSNISGEAVTG